jgi:hypothetical protein
MKFMHLSVKLSVQSNQAIFVFLLVSFVCWSRLINNLYENYSWFIFDGGGVQNKEHMKSRKNVEKPSSLAWSPNTATPLLV